MPSVDCRPQVLHPSGDACSESVDVSAGGHPDDISDTDAGIQPERAQHVGAARLAAAGRATL